jgi:hypothetical protein
MQEKLLIQPFIVTTFVQAPQRKTAALDFKGVLRWVTAVTLIRFMQLAPP